MSVRIDESTKKQIAVALVKQFALLAKEEVWNHENNHLFGRGFFVDGQQCCN
jgi:hypothetical protein